MYNQIQQQPMSPYNQQLGPRYHYMNPNYGYGSNYPSANPNYGNYAPLNQQGYYPVSSYVNGGVNNQQVQPPQQQVGMNGIKSPQSQSADVSNSRQASSGKTATV